MENEYGYQPECDFAYTSHLRDLMVESLGNGAVLFTTDGDELDDLKCGKIPEVYATVDFGSSKAELFCVYSKLFFNVLSLLLG